MLTRWDPFSEISRLQSEMFGAANPRAFAPAVDIREESDAIVLEAEVPGLTPEQIDVHVENNVLTLTGERSAVDEEKNDTYHRVERRFGSFTRAFVLPKGVDGEKIQANLEKGVLTLRLPKRPAPERRKIEIQA
ncbi:MAG: Hsp20/alpha crystallin family protein [Sandaracinaceae bacterium]